MSARIFGDALAGLNSPGRHPESRLGSHASCSQLHSALWRAPPGSTNCISMSRCVLVGSYDGHIAITCIDPTTPVSCLSARFAEDHHLSLTIQRMCGAAIECFSSAPIRLPSIGGTYVSRMRIKVALLATFPKFDLVIGADWIAATHATVTSDGLAQPSAHHLLLMQLGHEWEPFSEAQSIDDRSRSSPTPSEIIIRPEPHVGQGNKSYSIPLDLVCSGYL
jgi:hypothetical protein